VSALQENDGVTPGSGNRLNGAVGGPVRVARLNSLVAVRAELGRLYRESRIHHGRYPDALTASRLAGILGAISSSIELIDLEQRIAALEKR
jgi:hypothetical protein